MTGIIELNPGVRGLTGSPIITDTPPRQGGKCSMDVLVVDLLVVVVVVVVGGVVVLVVVVTVSPWIKIIPPIVAGWMLQ